MELVNCTEKYWEFVRILRNDDRVVDGFLSSKINTQPMHEEYMKKYSKYYHIALIDNHPCGYVGVIDDDIRICTHPDYQGKGIGKFMLNEIIKIYPTAYGKVKIENKASQNLFLSLGFKKKFIIFEYEC